MKPNRDHVNKGLDILQSSLLTYIPRELKAKLKDNWWAQGVYYALPDMTAKSLPKNGDAADMKQLDLQALLSLLLSNWNEVFTFKLPKEQRTYIHELREVRNKIAHLGANDVARNNADRWLDTIERVLEIVDPPAAKKVDALAREMRIDAAKEPAKSASAEKVKTKTEMVPAQSQLELGLKPWREVIEPHRDVAQGRYQQAEFAADLSQVVAGKAEPEYQDPKEFFARTYLTEGMRLLLTSAVKRLAGEGGEPVVQLKTAFGGGKTHTMLAVYHLVRAGKDAASLEGIGPALSDAGITVDKLPKANVAVLVGTDLSPAAPWLDRAGNGIEVRTLWGELAAQLGGKEGYALVRDHDRTGVSPGSDILTALCDQFAPAVVLIDELVAFARNIYGVDDLPAGRFDANMTFVQSLTEAARKAKRAIVLASIPESEIEIGTDAGREAQARMEQTFARMEAIWKPVAVTESFEIVRRRLFSQVVDEEGKDAACREFAKLYTGSPADFPSDAREPGYLARLRSAYPIHPEVFDRLYEEWSTLERFQRTRGVLRFMAGVIHALWASGDKSVMILPGNIPLEMPDIRNELTRYLGEGWSAIIDGDVDGPQSEPVRLDKENPRFGKYMASRRVARTIFLATAPHVEAQRARGIDAPRIRLGTAQPNESISVFNDALGRMVDRLTYLYTGDQRYWFDTRPNLRRAADDKAAEIESWLVTEEIGRRAKDSLSRSTDKAIFGGIHVFVSSGDVPDDRTVRLVVLSTESAHKQGQDAQKSAAIVAAQEFLEQRGNSPRHGKNMVLAVAPDLDRRSDLEQAVRQFLAWKWIGENAAQLNLDEFGRRQARENVERWTGTVNSRLEETFCWLLVPSQDGAGPWVWDAIRVGGSDPFVSRAVRKLRSNEQIIANWSPALLRMELDRWFWKDDDHVSIQRVWEAITTYGYLPRIARERVFRETVAEGLRSPDYFGYATSVSETGRYEGLVFDRTTSADSLHLDQFSVLVKPSAAIRQLDTDEAARRKKERDDGDEGTNGEKSNETSTTPGPSRPPVKVLRRYHGTVELDALRAIRDFDDIVKDVVRHLEGLDGSSVRLSLEIDASLPKGAPEHIVRVVSENARQLKFLLTEFEE